jgi:hypothetical protein
LKGRAKIDVTEIRSGAAGSKSSRRASPAKGREESLNGKVCGRLVKRHQVNGLGRKIAENDASDTHGELGFSGRAILDTNEGCFAYNAFTGKRRVWGKLNLNLPFRAGFWHFAMERRRVARDQQTIAVHVRGDAGHCRVPFTGEREHAREFHFDSFV